MQSTSSMQMPRNQPGDQWFFQSCCLMAVPVHPSCSIMHDCLFVYNYQTHWSKICQKLGLHHDQGIQCNDCKRAVTGFFFFQNANLHSTCEEVTKRRQSGCCKNCCAFNMLCVLVFSAVMWCFLKCCAHVETVLNCTFCLVYFGCITQLFSTVL